MKGRIEKLTRYSESASKFTLEFLFLKSKFKEKNSTLVYPTFSTFIKKERSKKGGKGRLKMLLVHKYIV